MERLPATDPMNLAVGLALFVGFTLYLFVLSKIVPGRELEGVVLEDGTRVRYRLNGLALFLITMGIAGALEITGVFRLSTLLRHFWGLFIGANALSVVITAALYVTGKDRPGSKRHEGALGRLADLWYGVELNPRWGDVDVKMFSYRPSLIGLALLNVSFAAAQWERDGALSTPMVLYQAFTLVYVFNYFQFEYGMLYTWDIVAERFGFMLVWGDYAFVPFCYSVVGWYLVEAREVPVALLFVLPVTFLLGLWIFRGANQQKDEFKRDPSIRIWGKPAETLGGKILVSGFWGIGRKLNYTGEILVYWSFTLLAWDASFVPYVLPTWLLCLLVHRAWRDDRRCRAKYGSLWEEYCRRATFKMIPFVY